MDIVKTGFIYDIRYGEVSLGNMGLRVAEGARFYASGNLIATDSWEASCKNKFACTHLDRFGFIEELHCWPDRIEHGSTQKDFLLEDWGPRQKVGEEAIIYVQFYTKQGLDLDHLKLFIDDVAVTSGQIKTAGIVMVPLRLQKGEHRARVELRQSDRAVWEHSWSFNVEDGSVILE